MGGYSDPRLFLDGYEPFLAKPLRLPGDGDLGAAIAEVDEIERDRVWTTGIDLDDPSNRAIELCFWRGGIEHADTPYAALVVAAGHMHLHGIAHEISGFGN